jgi:CRP-like cAMP-binding protein
MKEVLLKIGNFTQEEILAVENIAIQKFFPAKTISFQGDQIYDKLYFIKSGFIRCYRLIEGEDYTYFFFFQKR